MNVSMINYYLYYLRYTDFMHYYYYEVERQM